MNEDGVTRIEDGLEMIRAELHVANRLQALHVSALCDTNPNRGLPEESREDLRQGLKAIAQELDRIERYVRRT